MPDTEKVEWLATEVMGWHKATIQKTERSFYWFEEKMMSPVAMPYWNPLTDWNHWRQVEEKVMQNPDRFKAFVKQLEIVCEPSMQQSSWTIARLYVRADLPTRARALYLAYQSLR